MKVATVLGLSSMPSEAGVATAALVNNHQSAMRKAIALYLTETLVGLPPVLDKYIDFLQSAKKLTNALLDCDDLESSISASLKDVYPDI